MIIIYLLLGTVFSISKVELQKILESEGYREIDGGWSSYDSFEHEFWNIEDVKTVKITPHIHKVPVLNAARILTVQDSEWRAWRIPGQHAENVTEPLLSAAEALDKLHEFIGHERIVNSGNIYDLIFHHSQENNVIIPAYRYFDSLSNHVWIISGLDGSLIQSYCTVNHENAFVFPNGQPPSFGSRPPQTAIPSKGSRVGVQSIRNADFASLNTCFAYKCKDSSTSDCFPVDAICVDPSPELKEGIDYFTSTSYFTVPGQTFDFDKDWQSLGYEKGSVWLAWVNSPVAASRLSFPKDEVWGSDLAFNNYSGYEQDDAISELQAFYHLSNQAKFLRELIGDPTFCFVGTGPDCVTGISTSNSSVSTSLPIHFITNMAAISTFTDPSSKFPSFDVQFSQGLGKSKDSPIYFDQYTDYNNAFYNRQPFRNTPFNCSDAGCVDINAFQFTAIAFGQSSTSRDWALNECVVYHELVHALVAQYIPDIGFYVWSENGLRSDPGAMNEGWADYFAAINCGISDFTKTFNGHPKRNLENSRTCAEAVGEVHSDGLIFAGALWKVRLEILKTSGFRSEDQVKFDKLILRAILMGRATDLFGDQFRSILVLLRDDPKLSAIAPFAENEFKKREFDCVREFIFEESSDPTFNLPENVLTPVNLSTIPAQIKFKPRKSDWSAHLTWRQFANDGRLGKLDIGFAQQPMQLLISPCPIYMERSLVGPGVEVFSNCSILGEKTKIPFVSSTYSKLYGSITFSIPQNSEFVYMVIASNLPTNIVMYSSALTYFGFNHIWRVTFFVNGVINFIFLIFVILLLGRSLWKNNNINRKVNMILAICFLLETLSGLLALFGIIYGIVRSYFTIAMITITFATIPLHGWSFLRLKVDGARLVESQIWIKSYQCFQRWLVLFEILRSGTIFISGILIFIYSSPIWAHAIFYAAFLFLTALLHIIGATLLYYSFKEVQVYNMELEEA